MEISMKNGGSGVSRVGWPGQQHDHGLKTWFWSPKNLITLNNLGIKNRKQNQNSALLSKPQKIASQTDHIPHNPHKKQHQKEIFHYKCEGNLYKNIWRYTKLNFYIFVGHTNVKIVSSTQMCTYSVWCTRHRWKRTIRARRHTQYNWFFFVFISF